MKWGYDKDKELETTSVDSDWYFLTLSTSAWSIKLIRDLEWLIKKNKCSQAYFFIKDFASVDPTEIVTGAFFGLIFGKWIQSRLQ